MVGLLSLRDKGGRCFRWFSCVSPIFDGDALGAGKLPVPTRRLESDVHIPPRLPPPTKSKRASMGTGIQYMFSGGYLLKISISVILKRTVSKSVAVRGD